MGGRQRYPTPADRYQVAVLNIASARVVQAGVEIAAATSGRAWDTCRRRSRP
jgi:hypothetical protein